MKFADTQFARAIELVHSAQTGTSGKDKRRAARTPIRVPVAVRLGSDPNAQWTGARLHDISARGVQLEIPSKVEVGGSFLLRLPTRDGKLSATPLICRVAHCVPQNHSFVIGAEFVGPLTPEKSAGDNAAELDRIQKSILG